MAQTTLLRLTIAAVVAAISLMAATPALDFETYKTRVEPIFSKQREGHARCVVCHAGANNAFRLEEWGPQTKAYTAEQSRKNFETVSRIVVAGNPDRSILLKHPLAKAAGGDEFHSGGRQFESKDDPDWQAIAAWIRAAK